MPIKKRGGDGGTFNVEPLPSLRPTPKRTSKEIATAKRAYNRAKGIGGIKTPPKPKAPPKAPPKLTNVAKRRPMTSEYVYTDAGTLVIKAPASTAKWDHEFRLLVIRDYVVPRTLKNLSDYQNKYVENGIQNKEFKIQGRKVRVEYPHDQLDGTKTVILRTDIIDVEAGKRLFLHHAEPAMRILMVYCFLTGEEIGGVPKLIVDDHPS